MASRAARLRAIFSSLILAGVTVAPRASAADKDKEKKTTRAVVRYVGHLEDGKFRFQGKPVMLMWVKPLEGGRPVELIVPNKNMDDPKAGKLDPIPQVAELARTLKPDDVIKVEIDESKQKPFITYAKPYKLKAGEADPNTYEFQNSFRKEEGRSTYTAVVLSRYDEPLTVAVQQKKDKEGDMVSDPAILGLLQNLKTGELVEAEIKEGGRTPLLTSLERYAPQQKGKFLKMSEADVEGQKAPAVELEHDGKPVTAIVQGKLLGKRWTPEPKVLAAAKRLKPDAEVTYRARPDQDKLWLKEIEAAAKAPVDGIAPAARGARTESEKSTKRSDKDAGK